METADIRKLRIGDIMTPHPTTVDPNDTMRTVARIFEENEISGVPVVGGRGEVIGVVSRTDLIRHVLDHEEGSHFLFEALDEDGFDEEAIEESSTVLVEDLMNPEPVTAKKHETVEVVAGRMVDNHVHRIVITDDSDCPIGIVTTMDLLKLLRKAP